MPRACQATAPRAGPRARSLNPPHHMGRAGERVLGLRRWLISPGTAHSGINSGGGGAAAQTGRAAARQRRDRAGERPGCSSSSRAPAAPPGRGGTGRGAAAAPQPPAPRGPLVPGQGALLLPPPTQLSRSAPRFSAKMRAVVVALALLCLTGMSERGCGWGGGGSG